MDPDSNLAEQLRLAKRILLKEQHGVKISETEATRLAELVAALDEWIRHGGFLPQTWDRRRTVDRTETV